MSDEQEDKLDKILESVDKINRGLYGDQDNKQVGLMQRHYELADKVEKHEKFKSKIISWVAGFAAAVSLLVGIVWHFIKQAFGL